MKYKTMTMTVVVTGTLAIVGGWAIAAQDKYTVKVPDGIAFWISGDTKNGRQLAPVTPMGQTLCG
jgi:uncharacterized membrane protein